MVRIKETPCALRMLIESYFRSLLFHFGFWITGIAAEKECDYRFTCTCIGFFYVKYIEPVY